MIAYLVHNPDSLSYKDQYLIFVSPKEAFKHLRKQGVDFFLSTKDFYKDKVGMRQCSVLKGKEYWVQKMEIR